MTDTPKTFFQKLLAVQAADIKIPRTGVNPFTKTTYATLDDINEVYKKTLSDNNLVVFHRKEVEKDGEMSVRVLATYIVDAGVEEVPEGATAITAKRIRTSFELGNQTTAQLFGSQLTYGKRYNLGQLLNIVTDEDDDAEAEKQALIDEKSGKKPTAKQEVAAKAAQVAETATGANIAAVKKHLANKHGVTDKD